jgi:hypothetical protein
VGWLKSLSPVPIPGTREYFIARQFSELLALLRSYNCTFHGCAALGNGPVPHGISFRYDIHSRDVELAHEFLAFHLRKNIPATFFLMWDYANSDRARFEKFQALAKKASPPIELGLHDSPADSFLIDTKFSGNSRSYRRWTASPDAIAWLEGIAAQPGALAQFNASALERFKQSVARTREHFGAISAVAAHGGEWGQSMRAHISTLDPGLQEIATSFIARHWLTRERVSAAGLEADVEYYAKHVPGLTQVSDGGKSRLIMTEKIKRDLSHGKAVQILIHPYTWQFPND